MTIQDPGGSRAPGDRDGIPAIPDEVWQKFLEDSERAIRDFAPREPSARERAALVGPHRLDTGVAGEQAGPGRHPRDEARQEEIEAIGELWQPTDVRADPAWRDMDSRARRRRVGRVLGAVAAIVVILGPASRLPTGLGNGYGRQGDATLQQSEDAPDDLPTVPAHPSAPASEAPSWPTVPPG